MGAIFSEVGERNLLVPVNAQPFFLRSLLEINPAHTSSACLSGRSSHSAWAQDESTPPGVSVVQANARMPVSNENVEKGRERRIADGEIKKERVSYYRDNWRDSNGQSEQGGKKGEIEAPTQHPKTNPAILEIGTWNSGPRQELFLLSDFAFHTEKISAMQHLKLKGVPPSAFYVVLRNHFRAHHFVPGNK
ncbi:hypothetical protein G5I_08049 [Acromyrmex echinatior]|uniref:Uncharacterized protein n=1 Tax=Acromyrmex echinatior TaxID=103372 RepID=F4WQK4_ACREC|nr:hypothetical protein G5I_08049 [Acromyrmex echinatior]